MTTDKPLTDHERDAIANPPYGVTSEQVADYIKRGGIVCEWCGRPENFRDTRLCRVCARGQYR